MANKFTIIIEATDRATRTVKNVKKAFAQFTAPLTRIKTSIGALGKELGINKIAKGLTNAARGALGLATKIGAATIAMAGLTAAASIASLVDVARNWALAGQSILNTMAFISTTTDRLQSLRGAAQQFGLTAESLDGALKSVGDTMQDAFFGRNQGALVLINRLGIRMRRLKDGSIDAAGALYQIADAIHHTRNVQVQSLIAREFGVEQLLPMLRQGGAAMRAAEEKARRTGMIQSPEALARAQRMNEVIVTFKQSIEGLSNSIIDRLSPSFTHWLDQLTSVTQKITEAIQQHKLMQLLFDSGASVTKTAVTANGLIGFGPRKKGPQPWLRFDWSNKSEPVDWSPSAFGLGWSVAPRGVRTNNPGNLRTWGNQPVYGGYAAFANARSGISALAAQLLRYSSRHNDTIAGIVSTFAPAKDHNNVPAYIADVVARTGFKAGAHLNLGDRGTLTRLTDAIIAHENKGYRYDPALVASAINERLGAPVGGQKHQVEVNVNVKSDHPGTKVSATSKSAAVKTTARVEQSMSHTGTLEP